VGGRSVRPVADPYFPDSSAARDDLAAMDGGGSMRSLLCGGAMRTCALRMLELPCARGFCSRGFLSPLTNSETDLLWGSLAILALSARGVFTKPCGRLAGTQADVGAHLATDWAKWYHRRRRRTDRARLRRSRGRSGICSTGQTVAGTPSQYMARMFKTPFLRPFPATRRGLRRMCVGNITTADQSTLHSPFRAARADLVALRATSGRILFPTLKARPWVRRRGRNSARPQYLAGPREIFLKACATGRISTI